MISLKYALEVLKSSRWKAKQVGLSLLCLSLMQSVKQSVVPVIDVVRKWVCSVLTIRISLISLLLNVILISLLVSTYR